MRHTGGCAVGEISTRSRFLLLANFSASNGRHYANLFAFVSDHPNFAGTDAVIGSDKTFVDTVLRARSD